MTGREVQHGNSIDRVTLSDARSFFVYRPELRTIQRWASSGFRRRHWPEGVTVILETWPEGRGKTTTKDAAHKFQDEIKRIDRA
jgi:hypothetical protein